MLRIHPSISRLERLVYRLSKKTTTLWRRNQKLEWENNRLQDALMQLYAWTSAYPESIFREPTKEEWRDISNILGEHGYTLDAISASLSRIILIDVRRIIDKGLNE